MRGWGRLVGRLALVVGSVLLVLLAMEAMLRRWPTLLGQEFANGALTRYSTKADGIYYFDRQVRMNFMIPNHRTTMYYNGYVWQHQTDALGFRNDPLHVPADVVLLEVGLGGRLDATNVIEAPLATVIAPVSMDHTEFLGNSLTAIAGEKAAIVLIDQPAALDADMPLLASRM